MSQGQEQRPDGSKSFGVRGSVSDATECSVSFYIWCGDARAESFASAAAWTHHTTTTHDLGMFGRLPRFGCLRSYCSLTDD